MQLFCDEDFMTFSSGVLTPDAAHDRFDEMLTRGAEFTFAKQPVIERPTGIIVGYAGVDWFDLEGHRRLEFGYRLVPEARGRGYATEAGWAVLANAVEAYRGEILAIIDPTNDASQNVASKLGFTFWKQAVVAGYVDNLYRRYIDGSLAGNQMTASVSSIAGWAAPPRIVGVGRNSQRRSPPRTSR